MDDPSGRFVVRVPPSLHARLRRESNRLGVSLNDLCRTALQSCVAEDAPRYDPNGGRSTHFDAAAAVAGDAFVGVVLFGSTARGEALDSSDTDILVVVSSSVALEGIVLHEQDRVLTRALQGLRRAIADGLVERRYSHGHPYWVRNTEAAHAQ